MSFESVAQARPGGVDALVEQGFFDRGQQVVGQQTKKNVGVGAPLLVVEDWPDDERRFHVAEGILGAREQSVVGVWSKHIFGYRSDLPTQRTVLLKRPRFELHARERRRLDLAHVATLHQNLRLKR